MNSDIYGGCVQTKITDPMTFYPDSDDARAESPAPRRTAWVLERQDINRRREQLCIIGANMRFMYVDCTPPASILHFARREDAFHMAVYLSEGRDKLVLYPVEQEFPIEQDAAP